MIKSGEYIQIMEFYKENPTFFDNYSYYEQIEYIEAFKRFDELRIIHNKYKAECDNWNVNPNKGLNSGFDKLNMFKDDIKRITAEFKVRVEFFEPKHLSFKNGFHAAYFHEKTNVTDLIIFNKKRENSHVSH